LAQALVGPLVTVFAVEVFEGDGQQAGGEQGGAEVAQRQAGQPGGCRRRVSPAGEEQECDAANGGQHCQQLQLSFVELVE